MRARRISGLAAAFIACLVVGSVASASPALRSYRAVVRSTSPLPGACPTVVAGPLHQLVASRTRLVRPDPDGALICQYGQHGHLLRSGSVGPGEARHLARLADRIAHVHPLGPTSCPADIGTVRTLYFSYPQGQLHVLRWLTSGCQTVTNGRLTVYQGGNPSFWVFQSAFADLAHQLHS